MPISGHVIMAHLENKICKITLFQSYAPTEPADIEEKTGFYEQLNMAFSNVRKGDIIIRIGDLNAKVCNNNKGLEIIMCTHGVGVKNKNDNLSFV